MVLLRSKEVLELERLFTALAALVAHLSRIWPGLSFFGVLGDRPLFL